MWGLGFVFVEGLGRRGIQDYGCRGLAGMMDKHVEKHGKLNRNRGYVGVNEEIYCVRRLSPHNLAYGGEPPAVSKRACST